MPVLLAAPVLPPPDRREILRYMRCPAPDEGTAALLEHCLEEALPVLTPRVAYAVFEIETTANGVRFPFENWQSRSLAGHLAGCRKALLFGATLGVGLDRLIASSGADAAAAFCHQAIGAERVEALCDAFCAQQQAVFARAGCRLTGRFSPGYGDLPLETQQQLFCQLDLPRSIGLTLNKSLIMSPSKSVTAIVGIAGEEARLCN